MGAHHHRRADPSGSRLHRTAALAVVAPLALLTLVALVWLWPSSTTLGATDAGAPEVPGRVTAAVVETCPDGAPEEVQRCGRVRVVLETGEEVTAPLPGGLGEPDVEVGQDVLLLRSESPDGVTWSVVDHQRGTGLWLLAAAFVLALVAFGRWRGVSALVGLGATFAILTLFVIPAILGGENPLLVAVVGSSAVVLVVLYLTHGLSLSTTVAVLGTLASLALTGLLAAVAVAGLHLTGVTDDLSASVGLTQGIDMRGLLLAGIVIGSLGVLDDVTVTQAATVDELARANPAYGFRQLHRAGSRVGRAHVASVVNTIVLAYAGSSLPLLVLMVADNGSLAAVVPSQVVAQEVVRSAVATIGLIAAVPMTTALAAWAFRPRSPLTDSVG
ncbi:YibE/F family protein [Nocardioides hwasunensis]|uniref:YibE/F family protein n=1 Tax=Nocardioides hwasunensis TaxID=397258 RepID=A0ABR8MHZ3_9ACTN|nr:YibE/F family protein [Nocardioides hwasunensis]MBD3915684.1 YibE/F family protein [Nocardioides hwasunensis]